MLYQAERDVEVAVPPNEFFELVWDFETYPEFVTGVVRNKIARRTDREAHVEVTAKLMGIPFRYELSCVREPSKIRWARVAGAFEIAEGSWTLLETRSERSRFRYENAVDPGVPVPGFIIQYVLDTSLPRLTAEFRARAEALARLRTPGREK